VLASTVILLVFVFFFTALVSVVTGSTSIITVPVMIEVGIEPHVAVATNMLALVFLSVGGTLSFKRKGIIDRRILPLSVVLTTVGSGIGAFLLLDISTRALQLTIAIAMVVVAALSLFRTDSHAAQHASSCRMVATGYALTFILSVYGGLFSGGYVTLLTAVLVLFFGLSFLESVATTKVINLFSSLVATLVFVRRGVIDYKLGVILGVVMFVGAVLGGRVAVRMPAVWLRRVFVIAVIALAANVLVTVFR
jgi:uncharacterized protein